MDLDHGLDEDPLLLTSDEHATVAEALRLLIDQESLSTPTKTIAAARAVLAKMGS